jgi:hypothetical protein
MKGQRVGKTEYKGAGDKTPLYSPKGLPSYTYVIRGANTDFFKAEEVPSILFNPNYLKKVTSLKLIGDPIEGFDHTELGVHFERVKPSPSSLNIILNMHGQVILGKYTLTTKALGEKTYEDSLDRMSLVKNIEASEVITELVKATDHTPLNLFVLSCYGENLQQFLPLLPRKSIMITLSDGDKETQVYDAFNENMRLMYDAIQEFSIFDLLHIYCISQTYIANTPSIGFFDKNGVAKHLKLSDFAPKIIEIREKPSPFLAKLFAINNITSAHLKKLHTQVNHETSIEGLKPPKNLILEMIAVIVDELNKIFTTIGIDDDPRLKYQFIWASNRFLDCGSKESENYNKDITELLSLSEDPLEVIKQKWAQKYYFNHEAFLQKITFKVSDYRQLVELFFQQERARLLWTTPKDAQEETMNKIIVEHFASEISEFDYNFPPLLTQVTCVSSNSDDNYTCPSYIPSSLPSYSLILAKSVDAAKRHIQIQTQVQESLLVPYPDDFDTSGKKWPSSNDNPCLASRELSGAYEEYGYEEYT